MLLTAPDVFRADVVELTDRLTMVGFASLAISDFTVVRQLGLPTALGLLLAQSIPGSGGPLRSPPATPGGDAGKNRVDPDLAPATGQGRRSCVT